MNHQNIVWTVAFAIVAASMLYQCVHGVKRKLCLRDEDYIREYYIELELAERIDLTPLIAENMNKAVMAMPPRFPGGMYFNNQNQSTTSGAGGHQTSTNLPISS